MTINHLWKLNTCWPGRPYQYFVTGSNNLDDAVQFAKEIIPADRTADVSYVGQVVTK